MRYLVILVVCLNITACGTIFRGIAAVYDSGDACQSRGRANYQYPTWCGASGSGAYVTRDANSYRAVSTTRRESW